jgi:DNA-directed RNA polymerase specialized sigma24 family protein
VKELDIEDASRRYGPMVLRRCRQLLRDENEALDAWQDVFLRLLERRERLDARYPSSLRRARKHAFRAIPETPWAHFRAQ